MADEGTILKQAQAAAWALNQIGRQDYINLCQRFIENAYGTSGQYRSAAVAGNALNMSTDPMEADVGDLVFFRPDPSNGGAGHVGINIGNGQMVSSTNKGVQVDNFLTNSYWKNLLVGIGDPPPQWSGRPDAKDLVSGATTMVSQAKASAGNAVSAAWGAAAPYAQQLMDASERHGVPVNVLAGLLIQESGGDPRAVSHAGAQGLMQFMPGTARGLGIDPFDPAQAIDAGARYLKQMADRAGGDWSRAVGMYNAGPAGNLNNAETRNHIVKVMGFAEGIGASMGGGAAGGPGLPPPGGGGRRPEDDEMPQQQQRQRSGFSYLLDYIGQLTGWDQGAGPPPSLPSPGDVAGAVGSAAGLNDSDRTQARGNQVTSNDRPNLQGPNLQGPNLQGPNIQGPDIRSGSRPQQGGQPIAPGVPGMEGITRGGRNGTGPSIQISMSDLQEAVASGGTGLQDFLRDLVTRSMGPAGGMVAGAAGNAVAQGMGRAGQAVAGGSFFTPPPGAPGGGSPPDRNRPGARGENAPAGSLEPMGPPGPPAARAERGNPPGWTDPSRYTGAQRAVVEEANSLAGMIADANEVLRTALPTSAEYFTAQANLNNAHQRLVQLAPQLNALESETKKAEEGILLPNQTPYQKSINVLRKKPDGSYELVPIANPNAEENPSITTQRMQGESAANVAGIQGATSRDVAGIQGATSRDVAGIQGATSRDVAGISAGAQLGVANIGAQSAANVANIGAASAANVANISSATQRTTAALSAAIEQQKTLIDAQIRRGDLSLREGMARWEQWKTQNVDAPLAILRAQREAEQYRISQQQAITQRTQAQGEHERGIAQIGQQMFQSAAQAYNQTIPNTVGRGWGDRFAANLAGNGPYQANTGAAFDVPYSMDDYAKAAMRELQAGISPYAGLLGGATQAIGDPGQSMSGDQMAGLTQTAVNTAQGALNNPYVMPAQPGITMPTPIDPANYVGAGQAGSPNLIIPPYQQTPMLPQPSSSGSGYGRG